jgi:hypothetical protein
MKIRIRQKLCRTGAFMIALCYLFGILCVYEPRLLPMLVVLVVDTCLTIVPSYFQIIEQKKDDSERE